MTEITKTCTGWTDLTHLVRIVYRMIEGGERKENIRRRRRKEMIDGGQFIKSQLTTHTYCTNFSSKLGKYNGFYMDFEN